jgi:DNA modification methylase
VTLHYTDDWLTVHLGDCRAVLAELPAESVHCVVTSPPYWGLRDYGTASWVGGDEACDHLGPPMRTNNKPSDPSATFHGGANRGTEPWKDGICRKCGATRVDSQLGLEPTPEAYVEAMVAVFREVRRVLRSDGTVWLNLGDSYNSTFESNKNGISSGLMNDGRRNEESRTRSLAKTKGQGQHIGRGLVSGLKPKDLVGIPWRVAFALQADGWYLRSDIIWSKPNPMPESVTDRPTKAHEYLFLLSKSPRYYFDADAVREAQTTPADAMRPVYGPGGGWTSGPQAARRNGGANVDGNPAGRNLRTVWTIATAPYPGAHFATFPPKLVEPCIKAGTSERGVCPECGAPWERVVERGQSHYASIKGDRTWQEMEAVSHARGEVTNVQTRTERGTVPSLRAASTATTGWEPSCACQLLAPSGLPAGLTPVPATVLDPFAGSGTTAMVAQSLSRRAILIDLNADYLGQVMERNKQPPLGLGA